MRVPLKNVWTLFVFSCLASFLQHALISFLREVFKQRFRHSLGYVPRAFYSPFGRRFQFPDDTHELCVSSFCLTFFHLSVSLSYGSHIRMDWLISADSPSQRCPSLLVASVCPTFLKHHSGGSRLPMWCCRTTLIAFIISHLWSLWCSCLCASFADLFFCSPLALSVVLTTHSCSAPCTNKRFSLRHYSNHSFNHWILFLRLFVHVHAHLLNHVGKLFSSCRRPCCSSLALQYVSVAAVRLLIHLYFVAAVCSLFIVFTPLPPYNFSTVWRCFPRLSFFFNACLRCILEGLGVPWALVATCLSSPSEPHLSSVCAASSQIHRWRHLKNTIA